MSLWKKGGRREKRTAAAPAAYSKKELDLKRHKLAF